MARKLIKKHGKTKSDLTNAVYRRHGGLTKNEAAGAVEAIFHTVKESLVDGRAVRIRNFGVFEVASRQDRTGVDPSTGERIQIPAHKGLSFRPARKLKQTVTDKEFQDK